MGMDADGARYLNGMVRSHQQAPGTPQHMQQRSTGSIAHDITQNVMAQSRSINESIASVNMGRGPTKGNATSQSMQQVREFY